MTFVKRVATYLSSYFNDIFYPTGLCWMLDICNSLFPTESFGTPK